jgi:hypothetical protein
VRINRGSERIRQDPDRVCVNPAEAHAWTGATEGAAQHGANGPLSSGFLGVRDRGNKTHEGHSPSSGYRSLAFPGGILMARDVLRVLIVEDEPLLGMKRSDFARTEGAQPSRYSVLAVDRAAKRSAVPSREDATERICMFS